MESSKRALEVGLACLKCKMEISIKAASRMGQKMGKENFTKLMVQYAKGTSSTATSRVMGPSGGPTGPPIREKSRTGCQRGQESRFGKMGTSILALSKRGKGTGRGR